MQASLAQGISEKNMSLLQKMPQVPLANYAFHNNGDLTFTNMAEAWGLAQPGFSNGAAYVDLNNTGELDLVVNNINAPASIYRNRAREMNGNSYLTVALRGSGANTAGIGTKVIAKDHGWDAAPRAATDSWIPFLGRAAAPFRIRQVNADRLVDRDLARSTVPGADERAGEPHTGRSRSRMRRGSTRTLSDQARARLRRHQGFSPTSPASSGVNFKHEEDTFFDYNREPLMPHLLSTEGPALAVADVNGDGLDDIYVGGAKWQQGKLFLQQR